MLDVLPESESNVLILHATGKLTDDDYQRVLIPRLEAIIEAYGKARILIEMKEDFEGWELGAAWEDAKLGVRHRTDFEKIAVVGAPQWVDWGAKIGAHFMSGELRTYDEDDFDDALDWIQH
ncbi:MAG: STAS/SEC14 domain-containing protein [Alphaproteobacteria bacterium]|jgi:hypothetical protein|nr:STAS/SEC14 domain-containing protein [Alphaproteobacteria bacterium]